MHHALRSIRVRANKADILEDLKKNLENHKKIVEEARAGYIEKAKVALERKLAQLREGKLVSLYIQLVPAADHSDVYTSMITMLELHQEDTIELDAEMVGCLIEDKWEWSHQFYVANAPYSKSAFDEVRKLGGDPSVQDDGNPF